MTDPKAATPAARSPAAPTPADATPEAPHPTGQAARERHAIDTGRTDDKVAASDPAMSPLGTDDEAAQGHDEAGLATARNASKPSPGAGKA